MKNFLHNSIVWLMAASCALAVTVDAQAITAVINAGVIQNADNRPFFTTGGPAGISGTATPDANNVSIVSGFGLQVAGTSALADLSDGNGVPLGVTVVYDLQFQVQTTAGSTLSDGGNPGLGVNSGGSDPNANRLNPGEQLLFDSLQISNVSFIDPLGLIQPGGGGNPLWRALRSNDHASPDSATVSSDAAVTLDVKVFDDAPNKIEDNLTAGTFPPMSSVYVTTTAGDWRLKGIGYQADISFDLAATQPATRRTFKFADIPPAPSYDNFPSHSLTDNDTTVTITAVGDGALLDTSTLGVGVNSTLDDAEMETGQRRINGTIGEAIHFSFDQQVSLESLTLGALDLNGLETLVVSHVSGVNPFTGLTGYSVDYTVGPDSISFTRTDPKADTPYLVTFGMGDQGQILIPAGTVLSVTANPVDQNGILLDMITVNLVSTAAVPGDYNNNGTVDAADYVLWRDGGPLQNDPTPGVSPDDYDFWRSRFGATSGSGNSLVAVPEPGGMLLLMIAATCWRLTRRREG